MSFAVQSNTEDFKARHRAALVKTMDDLGSVIETDIKDRIDIAYPPASEPHESPHRRTGLLQTGTGHQTEETDRGVTTTIYSSRAGGNPLVPIFLEYGTQGRKTFTTRLGRRVEVDRGSLSGGMVERPFMVPARDYWEPKIGDEIVFGLMGNIGIEQWQTTT